MTTQVRSSDSVVWLYADTLEKCICSMPGDN